MIKQNNGCAFNYMGSKLRFASELNKILPIEDNLKVLECFCGGFSLIHTYSDTWNITANDKQQQLVDLHRFLQKKVKVSTPESVVHNIKEFCHCYINNSNKCQKEPYERLRADYNNFKSSVGLYALLCSSFSNQIRFNKGGEFNCPKGNRYFNPSMEKKLLAYLTKLQNTDVEFYSKDFREFDFENYDLIISDSPYSYNNKSVATYNENGGWQLKDLLKLLSKLDEAHENGVKFVFFNELITKGEDNIVLQEWSSKYNIKILRDTMTNCNYQRTDKRTVEFMAWNYG